jgi:hypothetical protein
MQIETLLEQCTEHRISDSLCIRADSRKTSVNLIKGFVQQLAKRAMDAQAKDVLIFFPDCPRPWQIPADMALETDDGRPLITDKTFAAKLNQAIDSQQEDSKMPRGIITKAEFDWNALASGINPVYISTMKEQDNLYVNAAVIQAQSGKPAKSLLNDTAHSLNSDEELQNRCSYVARGENLIEYQYEALRWFKDSQTQIWIRRGMTFTSNIWGIEYLGEPCWIEEVLDAVPLNYHVDNIAR